MRQRTAAAAGIIVACVMVLFPPFFDTGGLFGKVRLAFVLTPPRPIAKIDYRPALAAESLVLELSTVTCFAAASVLADDRAGSRAASSAFRCGAFVACVYTAALAAVSAASPDRGWTSAPFLLCVIPLQLPGGYFLFWLRLAALGVITLGATYAAQGRTRSSGLAAAAAGIALGSLIVVVTSVAGAAWR